MKKIRLPLILPLSSYGSLPTLPALGEKSNAVYGELILSFLSHLSKEGGEKKLVELGKCDCYPLYSLIEEIYYSNSENTLPSLPQEERYELYKELHTKMLGNRIYLLFYTSMCNMYEIALRKYQKAKSIDILLQENIPFLFSLFLNFQFEDDFHRELTSEVRRKGFFENVYQSCSQDEYHKWIRFCFCGVPIFNQLFSPIQLSTINPLKMHVFPFRGREIVVYFSHIPVCVAKEEE